MKDYDYMVVSAYSPAKLRKMGKEEALKKVGLYDGDHFEQAVICPDCESEMYVLFNNIGEPEYAQCMSLDCGQVIKVHYTFHRNFLLPWE